MKKDTYDIMGIIFKILKIILMGYTQYCMSKIMEMQSRVYEDGMKYYKASIETGYKIHTGCIICSMHVHTYMYTLLCYIWMVSSVYTLLALSHVNVNAFHKMVNYLQNSLVIKRFNKII